MTGRSAFERIAAASFRARSSGRVRRAPTRIELGSAYRSASPKSCVPCITSSVTLTCTGPGRPLTAIVTARRTSSGTRSIRSMRMLAFDVGFSIPNWSDSCVAPRPPIMLFTSPVSRMSGTEAPNDSAAPLMRFVAPGPSVASAIAGRFATRAYASAANAPCFSSRMRTCRRASWRAIAS